MKRIMRSALALLLCTVFALSLPAVAADKTGTKALYSQLSPTAQYVYDVFCSSEAMQCFRTGEAFTMYFEAPFDDLDARVNEIYPALSAFELDYPELFWLASARLRFSYSDESMAISITPEFYQQWSSGERSIANDETAATAAVKRIAKEARTKGGIYEQLLYVHDWLTTNNAYNSAAFASGNTDDFLPYTPLSALTNVSQPVCQGYATAFKMICDELGISCLVVSGEALGSVWGRHAWNEVRLNGKWYAVDVTFDDPTTPGISSNKSGNERCDYFLVGSDTKVNGSSTFSSNHKPTGERFSGIFYDYPKLSAKAYNPKTDPEPVPEPVPVLKSAAAAEGRITVRWNALSGATKYAVYRKTAGGSWTRLTNSVTGTSYTDKSADLQADTVYYYTVRAYVDGAWGGCDNAGVSAKALASKIPVLTGACASAGQITVKWNSVNGASKYAIYRKTTESDWTRLANTVTGTSYTDKSSDLKAGTTYYYTVRAYVGSAWGSYDTTGVSVKAK